MSKTPAKRWKIILALVLVLAVAAGLGWWQRTSLLSWYCLWNLDSATEANRAGWVEMIIHLDEAAIPGLLQRFSRQDAQACKNATNALSALARKWGKDDPRTLQVSSQICAGFDMYSNIRQEAALEWQIALLHVQPDTGEAPAPRQASEVLIQNVCHLLKKSAHQEAAGVRQRCLALANVLIEVQPVAEVIRTTETVVKRELKSAEASQRVDAIHLTLHSVFQDNGALLRHVVPLLKDENAKVRRAALLAVGSSPEVASEEQLLPLLHDKDEETRKLCEAALRSRGLHDDHILLGRLITDQRPSARLKIVQHLPAVRDIDPAIWLQRLSQDPSDAVRAAAIRLGGTSPDIDFQRQLVQMAQSDPSETVRQLAQFYLKHPVPQQ